MEKETEETKSAGEEVTKEVAKKGLTKTAKIAIGATAGVVAVAAIVIPTAVVLSQNDMNSFDVTIDYNIDGMSSESVTVGKEAKISDLKLKPVEGYYFVGWFKDEECTERYNDDDVITADSTIYAKYQAITFMVSMPTSEHFTIVDATTNEELSAITNVEYKGSISFKINLDEQYNQSQIVVKVGEQTLTAQEGVYTIENIQENIVLTIEGVEINSYQVKTVIDGVETTSVVEYGQTLSEKIPSVTSENSLGWYADEEMTENVDFSTPITSDMTLYTKMATLDVLTFTEYPSTLPGQEQEETYAIAQITSFDKEEIVVPLTYNGVAVITLEGSDNSIESDNTILENIYFSKDIIGVGGYFNRLTALKSFDFSNVTVIDGGNFSGCISLTNIDLSSVSLSIFYADFSDCTSLQTVTLPNTITTINTSNRDKLSFAGCTALTEINLENITQIGQYSGEGVFEDCISLTNINLQNIQEIGDNTFSGCENLDVDFSTLTNLQSIGNGAFAMSGVTEFSPSSNLLSIGEYAFAGSNLKRVILNYNTNGIQWSYNFSGCSVEYIYWNTPCNIYDLFRGGVVSEGATVVIGSSLLDLDDFYLNIRDLNTMISDSDGDYLAAAPLLIKELVLEKGLKEKEFTAIIDIVAATDTIICDNQSVLNFFINYGFDMDYDYIKDKDTAGSGGYYNMLNRESYNLYIKADLEGAGDLENSSSINDYSTIVKQSESDREGYIKYVITYDTAS